MNQNCRNLAQVVKKDVNAKQRGFLLLKSMKISKFIGFQHTRGNDTLSSSFCHFIGGNNFRNFLFAFHCKQNNNLPPQKSIRKKNNHSTEIKL